jgi:hypothetical protein
MNPKDKHLREAAVTQSMTRNLSNNTIISYTFIANCTLDENLG